MSGTVLRILDANVNRCREALRVLEDHARFALNHDRLSAGLKAIRHDLTSAVKPFLQHAILWRDTAGDVGTDNKTPAELQRSGWPEVVTAAGKRLGEALRVIEESLKTLDPKAASAVEAIRYRFYSVEQSIAATLYKSERFRSVRLYVLITESCCSRPWLETAQLAIEGGAECLQLREKDLEGGELLNRARQFVALCREKGVISIINDRPDIAVLAGADGVHVGQGDLPAAEARKIVGPEKIVGVSTHNLDHAQEAVLDGADYIGVGPVFVSGTKPRNFLPGLDYAKSAASQIPLPTVAIAGITLENAPQVIATGVQAIAVTAAVCSATDPKGAARELRGLLR